MIAAMLFQRFPSAALLVAAMMVVAAAGGAHANKCHTPRMAASNMAFEGLLDTYLTHETVPTDFEARLGAKSMFLEWAKPIVETMPEVKPKSTLMELLSGTKLSKDASVFFDCLLLDDDIVAKAKKLHAKMTPQLVPAKDGHEPGVASLPPWYDFFDEFNAFAGELVKAAAAGTSSQAGAAARKAGIAGAIQPRPLVDAVALLEVGGLWSLVTAPVRFLAAYWAAPPFRFANCPAADETFSPGCAGAHRVTAETATAASCATSNGANLGTLNAVSHPWHSSQPAAVCPAPPANSPVIVGFTGDINTACPTNSPACGRNCVAENFNKLHLYGRNWNYCVNLHWVACGMSAHYPNAPAHTFRLATVPRELDPRREPSTTMHEFCYMAHNCAGNGHTLFDVAAAGNWVCALAPQIVVA